MNATLILSIVMCILAAVLMIAFEILLGVWVYRDATAHGANALMWVLLVILVPSFIGLILYLIIGRQEQYVPCPRCRAMIARSSAYCNCCGLAIRAEPPKKTNNKPLVVGMICCLVAAFVMLFAFIAGIVVFAVNVGTGKYEGLHNMTVGSSESSHWDGGWTYAYLYSDGTKTKNISSSDRDRNFILETTLESGEMTVEIYDDSGLMLYILNAAVENRTTFTVPAGANLRLEIRTANARRGSVDLSCTEAYGLAPGAGTFHARDGSLYELSL